MSSLCQQAAAIDQYISVVALFFACRPLVLCGMGGNHAIVSLLDSQIARQILETYSSEFNIIDGDYGTNNDNA